MPQFSITLTSAALAKLQAIVTAYNANRGTNLTVRDWMTLHLKELAVQADLAARAQALQQEKQEELTAALEAPRQQLLASL